MKDKIFLPPGEGDSELHLFTAKEVIAKLNISKTLFDKNRAEGKIQGRQIGNRVRYTLTDIADFVESLKESQETQ